jgi:putative transposase
VAFRRCVREDQRHCLWRAVDHEVEVLESFVTKTRDCSGALKFAKKTMKHHSRARLLVIDKLRSCCAAMKVVGNADK